MKVASLALIVLSICAFGQDRIAPDKSSPEAGATRTSADSRPAFDAAAFSSDQWPGRAPTEVQQSLGALASEFTRAMRAHDAAGLANMRQKMVASLGRYVGAPEERPVYGQPIDPTEPDAWKVARLWENNLRALAGRFGWEQAQQLQVAPGDGGRVPRLRVSERQIRALLEMHEAGLDPAGEDLRLAVQGLDYLLGAQTSGGAFGYPYDPKGAGLREMAAQQVERGARQGLKMVERGWVIEDLGAGGLNFDNGVCGAVLLQGYVLTGDRRYLDSALRAGAWAKSRSLALNFNYNGFSGLLLARLYRVTGDRNWLEAARDVFEFGVLSGQMPNGRWFDQHNAKIQYHAILCSQVTEYLLALRQADDASVSRVETQLALALDNLAAEHITYGTNNAHESLALGALCLGSLVLSPSPEWTRATNIALNYVTGPFLATAKPGGGDLPEAVATWLLLHAAQRQKLKPIEVGESLRSPSSR